MSRLLVGSQISMFRRVLVRLVVKGTEGVECFLELSNDVYEAHFYDVEYLLIFGM
jgi:hypothetical protein